ncbi:hypothetical protein CURT_1335 [Campylobacter ureolyticus]|uniref:Uncharacterized protein n=1 Tax=Campylobacter ureolyticus TaxID=827 RepID=A0AAE7JQA6_9BACT|nr:hypothetical protein CURT_1335 [Campylobacter ureolyticus]
MEIKYNFCLFARTLNITLLHNIFSSSIYKMFVMLSFIILNKFIKILIVLTLFHARVLFYMQINFSTSFDKLP